MKEPDRSCACSTSDKFLEKRWKICWSMQLNLKNRPIHTPSLSADKVFCWFYMFFCVAIVPHSAFGLARVLCSLTFAERIKCLSCKHTITHSVLDINAMCVYCRIYENRTQLIVTYSRRQWRRRRLRQRHELTSTTVISSLHFTFEHFRLALNIATTPTTTKKHRRKKSILQRPATYAAIDKSSYAIFVKW